MSKSSESGLFGKYDVREAGESVDECFVLEPETDPAAREALLAYADATDNDSLADDLREWVAQIEDAAPNPGYLFTEINYRHPFNAPDPDSVVIQNWFAPSGLRIVGTVDIEGNRENDHE